METEVGTYASSHLFAENRRWIVWSSISFSERRYESMSLPMGVVRSLFDVSLDRVGRESVLTGELEQLDRACFSLQAGV